MGATIAVAYGPSGAVDLTVPLAAFVGALVGVGLAYGLGRSSLGGRAATSLILAGVAVASFLTAIQTFLQQQRSETLRQVYSWILGRLGTAGWDDVRLALPSVVLAVATLWAVRRLLDVMEVGDLEAQSLGVNVARLRLVVVIAASLATAAAVAVAGLIGFVGIIVPHAVRLIVGGSYRSVLPLSVLFGASFMIFVDILARTVAAPAEIPIGVITALDRRAVLRRGPPAERTGGGMRRWSADAGARGRRRCPSSSAARPIVTDVALEVPRGRGSA